MPFLFWFDHFLGSRAEICQKLSLLFFGKFKTSKIHSEINRPSKSWLDKDMTQIDKQTARLNLAVIKVFIATMIEYSFYDQNGAIGSTSGISECTKRSYHSLQNRTMKSALLWSGSLVWWPSCPFNQIQIFQKLTLSKFYPDLFSKNR